jgi:hypothetical protein
MNALSALSLLLLVLLADFAITLLHSFQELKGVGAPLWRNFGAVVGLDISDSWGFGFFTIALTVTLFVLGFVGIVGILGERAAALALGVLIGARLSDTLVSHVLLHFVGYRPNPGLSSTPLYILEALFLAWLFKASLAAHPNYAWSGFAVGIVAFLAVLPGLWVARQIWPERQRPTWHRRQPMPAWAGHE